ncbi:hypothetical protein TNIN_81081 [Trichonephila inaurata madagascariensis]|uniref:Uncharacterized protein n=1 Tax=Trichonephila inaurata madagascariensis TaxID=2747483 RepID=A0A8X7BZS7_9ARAC|nr:hypothetical protein TNIN_81081 [Trichonephila inaurata madagascariensis]
MFAVQRVVSEHRSKEKLATPKLYQLPQHTKFLNHGRESSTQQIQKPPGMEVPSRQSKTGREFTAVWFLRPHNGEKSNEENEYFT